MERGGKYTNRALLGPDNEVEDQITVEAEVLGPMNIDDLVDAKIQLVQVVDDGTVTLSVEYSLDGSVWLVLTTKDQDAFAAAASAPVEVPLVNGATVPMPIAAKQVRVVATALSSSSAVYTASVTGLQGARA